VINKLKELVEVLWRLVEAKGEIKKISSMLVNAHMLQDIYFLIRHFSLFYSKC